MELQLQQERDLVSYLENNCKIAEEGEAGWRIERMRLRKGRKTKQMLGVGRENKCFHRKIKVKRRKSEGNCQEKKIKVILS